MITTIKFDLLLRLEGHTALPRCPFTLLQKITHEVLYQVSPPIGPPSEETSSEDNGLRALIKTQYDIFIDRFDELERKVRDNQAQQRTPLSDSYIGRGGFQKPSQSKPRDLDHNFLVVC